MARTYIRRRVGAWFRLLWIWNRLSPSALFLASFVVLIGIGTLGLWGIPGLHAKEPLGPIDSLFTMTSAVCVTGLAVTDTATQFTLAGKIWIAVFVEIGGLGLITLTTLIIGALGQRLSLRSEVLTMGPPHGDRPEVWEIAFAVTKFSLIVEAIGAVLLFLCFVPRMPADEALGHALFHAICAYCNAGFSTFSDNLMGYADSPATLIVISGLVLAGGLGYLAFEEVLRWWRTSRLKRAGGPHVAVRAHRLSTHTWAALTTSAVLLVVGWVLFAIFEWNDTLGKFDLVDKLANSLFLSVNPRSAGFNAVDYSEIGNDSATLTMMLMLVGGSPGSTAGRIKTTTLAVLIAFGLSRIRGKRSVELQHRSIPPETIERSMGIVILASLVFVIGFFILSAIQSAGTAAAETRQQFLPIVFETISAFATTGLSMSYTHQLDPAAKLVTALLMFIGRVGLLSFFTAVTLRRGRRTSYLRAAEEDVLVG